jgi:hypothetical protein
MTTSPGAIRRGPARRYPLPANTFTGGCQSVILSKAPEQGHAGSILSAKYAQTDVFKSVLKAGFKPLRLKPDGPCQVVSAGGSVTKKTFLNGTRVFRTTLVHMENRCRDRKRQRRMTAPRPPPPLVGRIDAQLLPSNAGWAPMAVLLDRPDFVTLPGPDPDAAGTPLSRGHLRHFEEEVWTVHRHPTSLTSLECHASELVDGDTCPHPAAGRHAAAAAAPGGGAGGLG